MSFKGPPQLLNECRQCKMKFENSQQLANHVAKFCKDSPYGDVLKLEQKYQENMKLKEKGGGLTIEDLKSKNSASTMNLDNLRNVNLNDIKENVRSKDDDFVSVQKVMQRNREKEMEEELNKLKFDKEKKRLVKQNDEQALMELIKEVEMKKDRELRARIEKEQIKKALVDLEKTKITTLEQEKKAQLQKLSNDRDLLKQREDELMNEILKMEQDMKTLEQIRKEDMQKVNEVAENFMNKRVENKKVGDMLLEEKSDRIANLRVKREQLENERLRIMNDLEKVRAGELNGLRRNQSGVIAAKSLLNDVNGLKNYNIQTMQDRLYNNGNGYGYNTQSMSAGPQTIPYNDGDRNSTEELKRIQNQFQNGVPAYGSQTMPNNLVRDHENSFIASAQRMMNGIEKKPMLEEDRAMKYNAIRQNIENIGQPLNIQRVDNGFQNRGTASSNPDIVRDISMMKQKYFESGGKDQDFIRNLENMENFHKQQLLNNLENNNKSMPNVPYDPIMNYGSSPLNDNIPAEIKALLDQKDIENARLKSELDSLKIGTDKINNMKNTGGFSLGDIKLKLGAKDIPNPYNGLNLDLYSGGREFFLQNEVRSVDLTEEERMLVHLSAQEVDALRLISQIPIGTELYRFKMEQFKELSTTRAEIEKIVQEQRLQKLRRDFEKRRREEDRAFDNDKWIDEQRRNILAARLKKDLQPPGSKFGSNYDRKYDPTEGLVIHWDYTLGIPKRNDYCRIVYGIFVNGEEVYAPRLIEAHETEIDTSSSNRCIFGESHHVADIPANANTLLIFEVHISPSKDSLNAGKIVSYGWSQLDLFDARRELRRGKYKVPLYECPTDTNQDIEGIKYLTPVAQGMTWMYLRISYPNNDEFGRQASIYPENSHMEYVIPQIHLRNFKPPIEYRTNQSFSRKPTAPSQIIPPQDKTLIVDPRPPSEKKPDDTMPLLPITEDKTKPKKEDLPDPSLLNQTTNPFEKKGLSVTIHNVKNHVAKSHFKVAFGIYEETSIIVDDNGGPCAHNTSVHNPLDYNKNRATDVTSVRSGGAIMSNKAQGQDIIFNEEHKFLRDVQNLIKRQQGKKDIYLNIQVLEKPEPVHIQTNNASVSYKAQDGTANYGGMEYELCGWLLFKLNLEGGRLINGRFTNKLYAPPLRKPPLDPLKKYPQTESYIEFTVQEITYDQRDLNEQFKEVHGKKKKKKKGPKPEEKKLPDEAIDNSPFIPNTKKQYSDKPFEQGHGIDFYVDGIRYLPDNATISRISVEVVNVNNEPIKTSEGKFPDFESRVFNPTYNLKVEVRPDKFEPTALAYISILTIDKSTNKSAMVGYAAMNLFINRFTNQQPKSQNETDIILVDGCYQLPVICEEPYRIKPFDMEALNKYMRLPCCSVLVRVVHCPLSDDGLRRLGIKDFPEKEWAKRGVWVPRPFYAQGAYNTSFCHVRDSEKDLFILRQSRVEVTSREAAQILLGADGINKDMNDLELTAWLDKKIWKTNHTPMIDLMYFAKYQPQAGFKFSLDGIHNAPGKIPYGALYMLNPPGSLFENPPDTSKVQLSSLLNWDGPLSSPQFLDGFFTFKDVSFQKNLVVLVVIKGVNLNKLKGEDKFTDVGWTIVPIFSPDGYIKSGVFQIPLVVGRPDSAVLKELTETDPWQHLFELIEKKKNKKLQWLGKSSIMCRVIDSQREGHFSNPWDLKWLDPKIYLPPAKTVEMAYNETAEHRLNSDKRFKTIVPNNGNPHAYNNKITEAFLEVFKLDHLTYKKDL